MKKFISLMLALVMVFSMSAVAFAANTNICPNCDRAFSDEAEYNTHLARCNEKTCTKCGEIFADEDAYNDHIEICTVGDEADYIDLTVKSVLEIVMELVNAIMEQWDGIEDVVIRMVDFVESIGGIGGGEEAAEEAE